MYKCHKDITIISVNAYNNRVSKYRKQELTELKAEINNSIIIVETSNKIKKNIEGLNNPSNQLDLIDRYKIFTPNSTIHFLSKTI